MSTFNKHHYRPRSRGGDNSHKNYQRISKEGLHEPYHHLFTNLRPHEVVILFIFSWGTQYIPYTGQAYSQESADKYTEILASWRKLFGENESSKNAIRTIKNMFVRTRQDGILMSRALRFSAIADSHDIVRLSEQKRAKHEEQSAWVKNKAYRCIFGRLDPHEAILLVGLSWDTICPHQEFLTPHTFAQADGKMRRQMKTRISEWNSLFGENMDRWTVIYVLRSLCNPNDQPVESQLIKQALDICRKMESR